MTKPCLLHMIKTKTQISYIHFATYLVQSLYFLNPKFQASSHFYGCTARFVSDLVGNPIDWFSHEAAITPENFFERLLSLPPLN